MLNYHEKTSCAIEPDPVVKNRVRWEEHKPEVINVDLSFNCYFWRKFAYLDYKKERTPHEVDEIMDAVMADLHGTAEQGASEFDIALFRWCFAPYSKEIRDLLDNLLKEGIRKELRKRWEQEHA